MDFLDFDVNWEHRFEKNAPLFMQVSKSDCVLHLSEHYGDCCPGSAIRIDTDELDDYHKLLNDSQYKYYRPGIDEKPWGKEISVKDPFGNRLIFSKVDTVG